MSQYVPGESMYHKIQLFNRNYYSMSQENKWISREQGLLWDQKWSHFTFYMGEASSLPCPELWLLLLWGNRGARLGVRGEDAFAGENVALHHMQQHRIPASIPRSNNPPWNLLFRNTTISLLTADNCMVSIDPTMPANTERWALLPPAPPEQAQVQGQGRCCLQKPFVCSGRWGWDGTKKSWPVTPVLVWEIFNNWSRSNCLRTKKKKTKLLLGV